MYQQKFLDPLIHYLKIPSISTQEKYKSEMEAARHFLVDTFSSMGFETKILKGVKHDAVFASLTTNYHLPSALIYGHYDVQPPEPLKEWKTSPFEPTVKNGNIYARGATDQKAQLMVHIMAIKKLMEYSILPGGGIKNTGSEIQLKNKNKDFSPGVKRFPANFKFLIEGEEEIGSLSIESMAKQYGNSLLKSDYIIVSDSQMYSDTQPAIDISLRGLTYAEIRLKTARHDLHSGQFGGVAENPVKILANVISRLKDEDEKVLVPHFYDEVENFTPEELRYFKNLKTKESLIKKEGGLFLTGGGETDYSINERRWTRPSLDINGIWGGYHEEGSKTIIPAEAGAKVSMRLVPNQNPEKIFNLFSSYVRKLIPKGVEVEIIDHASCLPYKAPTDHVIYSLAQKSIEKVFKNKAVYSGVGGSIGFVPIMAKALKAPVLMLGFGLSDDNLHAPNEKYSLENYYKWISVMTDFYSQVPKL